MASIEGNESEDLLKAMNLRIFTDQDLSTYSTVKAIKCMVEEIEHAYIDIRECDRST